jgi:hypothetical protein
MEPTQRTALTAQRRRTTRSAELAARVPELFLVERASQLSAVDYCS